MPQPSLKPQAWRIVLGFLVAPFVAAVLLSALNRDPTILWPALIYGAYPATIVIGIPLYFALRNLVPPRLWILMLAGGFVAAFPWALLLLSPPDQASVGNCVAVVDGRTTWCGMLQNAGFLGYIFAFGALGGLVFWLCAVWRGPGARSEA
jgi:hypothetical protein